MNRLALTVTAALFAATSAVYAQDANPMTTNMKQSWDSVQGLISKMAEKMPEDGYRFKPTPEMQDFGGRMGHIAGANMRTCAGLKGEQKNVTLSAAPTKAEILTALKETGAECDAVFATLNDAELGKMTNGRGGPRMKAVVVDGMLQHSQEMYGYMAVYLRLKGIVPPSSDRNEK